MWYRIPIQGYGTVIVILTIIIVITQLTTTSQRGHTGHDTEMTDDVSVQ